ncbi:O-antigen ligase family protein [Pseudomonas fluorescens]|uniref:O-antigen ligase-related domain-containing protein n=1 Tax=Pseudomonas fluorescens TaxID=294 RepID=A0A5E7D444_PSEFL|nr:O-antigen ligase family protein [Pseudomonas fluorescens]VVO06585.1 hypothetical protein PS723_03074 [Pseudomonas fluorescens]
MIIPLSMIGLLAALCLALLASPYPYLAPGAVVGLVGVAILYRRPSWGVLGIVALVPFEGLMKDSSFSGAKFLGISLALILSLQLLLRQLPASRLRSNLWPLLLGFMTLYLLSLWTSDNVGLSVTHLRDLIVGLLLFVITLLVGREMNMINFCRMATLSVTITSAVAMFSTQYQEQGRASAMLDPNALAMLIAFAIPQALLLAQKSPNMLQRLGWLACFALLLGGMTKTESRSGLVVLLISLAIGIYHYRAQLPRIRPRHLGFAMLGIAIVIPLAIYAMPAGYIKRIQSLSMLSSDTRGYTDESLGRRASYIVVGSKMIREHPLLGTGPGTFPLHYAVTGYAKAFSSKGKESDLYRRAHNTYLELFSELGIPAALLFVSMLALALRNILRARSAWLQRRNWDQADLVTHLGVSLLSLSLFLMFLSAPNLKYLWIMLALSCVLRFKAEESPLPEPRP